MVGKKKGRIPRNKKKSWKKQVDISEVEQYLDDVRLQERFGGLVAERESKDLFTVDTQPETASAAASRSRVDLDNLVCFQNLKGLPGAKVPVTPNYRKDKETALAKRKKGAQRVRREVRAAEERQAQQERQPGRHISDPWDDDDAGAGESDVNEWMEAGISQLKRARTAGRLRRPLHLRVKPSLLPAVELPHPGQSYHPETEDHDDLLNKALQVEYRKAAEEQKWHRRTYGQFPSQRPTEADWLAEMSGGLPGAEEPEPTDGAKDDKPPPARKPAKPKTRRQRRRARERQQAEQQRQEEVATRRREADVFRVKSISRELRAAAARTAARQQRRAETRADKALRPLTLSRHTYQTPTLELNLTEELPGCLRRLRAEGNPLQERLSSLQRRNVIETRVKTTQKRKYKVKRFARVTAGDREPNKLKTERNF